jgi:mannose-6-phosphate isomerase-like protein (cupin superfamily)
VVADGEVELIEGRRGVVSAAQLFVTDQLPFSGRAAGNSEKFDMGIPGLAWMVLRWEPDSEWSMHFTDTIDLNFVLKGTIELVLDDGGHRLEPGDSVVVAGVDHAWRVGDDGCTVIATVIGTPAS